MAHSKGSFFFDEDGVIVSHQYTLSLSKETSVWLTIEPFPLKAGGESRQICGNRGEGGGSEIDVCCHIGQN